MPTPQVSFVMPVYNAACYLQQAVASVRWQTVGEWELVAVDDGSTDESGELLDAFARRDERIRVVHQPNSGIVGALNAGIAAARAPLIARIDSDDVAVPWRLERQLAFHAAHPDVVAFGSAILCVDPDGDPIATESFAEEHREIVERMLVRRTGMAHPSVMMQRSAITGIGGYRPPMQWVEDHDLWLRLATIGPLANQHDVLLHYRLHEQSVCWSRRSEQAQRLDACLIEAYQRFGRRVPPSVLAGPGAAAARLSPAPGKWARRAARSGYYRTSFKHLRSLAASQPLTPTFARVAAETAGRGLLAAFTRPAVHQPLPDYRTFALPESLPAAPQRAA